VGVESVRDHASLSLSDVYGLFCICLTIFSFINDYGGADEDLNELKVSLSWIKSRVLMIMQGLAFF